MSKQKQKRNDDELLKKLFASKALSIWDRKSGPILWGEDDMPVPFKLDHKQSRDIVLNAVLFKNLQKSGLIKQNVFKEIDLYFKSRKDWAKKYLFTNTELFNMAAKNDKSTESLKRFIEKDPWDFESAAGDAFKLLKKDLGDVKTPAAKGGGSGKAWITSAQTTLHCLTGCVIGEVAGLMIGVSLGWGAVATIGLATGLAYLAGFTLGILPIMKRENMTAVEAFKVVWLGELVSIGSMEIVMNAVDYAVGGMAVASVMNPTFWLGIAAAIPAGFIMTWPVNHWLLKKQIKKCHHHDAANADAPANDHCSGGADDKKPPKKKPDAAAKADASANDHCSGGAGKKSPQPSAP